MTIQTGGSRGIGECLRETALRPVVYVNHKNYGDDGDVHMTPMLSLRTIANFGQNPFTNFDMVRFTESYFDQQKQRFEIGARSLPDEIVTMIAIIAAEDASRLYRRNYGSYYNEAMWVTPSHL